MKGADASPPAASRTELGFRQRQAYTKGEAKSWCQAQGTTLGRNGFPGAGQDEVVCHSRRRGTTGGVSCRSLGKLSRYRRDARLVRRLGGVAIRAEHADVRAVPGVLRRNTSTNRGVRIPVRRMRTRRPPVVRHDWSSILVGYSRSRHQSPPTAVLVPRRSRLDVRVVPAHLSWSARTATVSARRAGPRV